MRNGCVNDWYGTLDTPQIRTLRQLFWYVLMIFHENGISLRFWLSEFEASSGRAKEFCAILGGFLRAAKKFMGFVQAISTAPSHQNGKPLSDVNHHTPMVCLWGCVANSKNKYSCFSCNIQFVQLKNHVYIFQFWFSSIRSLRQQQARHTTPQRCSMSRSAWKAKFKSFVTEIQKRQINSCFKQVNVPRSSKSFQVFKSLHPKVPRTWLLVPAFWPKTLLHPAQKTSAGCTFDSILCDCKSQATINRHSLKHEICKNYLCYLWHKFDQASTSLKSAWSSSPASPASDASQVHKWSMSIRAGPLSAADAEVQLLAERQLFLPHRTCSELHFFSQKKHWKREGKKSTYIYI